MINAIKKFNFKNSIILKMIMALYLYKYINNLKIIKKLIVLNKIINVLYFLLFFTKIFNISIYKLIID